MVDHARRQDVQGRHGQYSGTTDRGSSHVASGSSANVKRFWWPQHPPLIGCVPTQWTMTELKPSRAKLRAPPFMYPSQ